jgi:predicted DNA-binding transcriptional regulator AlpA
MTFDDELINDREVARVIGRSVATVRNDRLHGRGVPFVKVGRLVRYRKSDVRKYIADLPTRRSTTDDGSKQ